MTQQPTEIPDSALKYIILGAFSSIVRFNSNFPVKVDRVEENYDKNRRLNPSPSSPSPGCGSSCAWTSTSTRRTHDPGRHALGTALGHGLVVMKSCGGCLGLFFVLAFIGGVIQGVSFLWVNYWPIIVGLSLSWVSLRYLNRHYEEVD